MGKVVRLAGVIIILAVVAVAANADVPTSMTVQGRLTDGAADPLDAGAKNFTFKIFDAEIGGSEVWPRQAGETQSISTDDDGLWTADLGVILPLTVAVFMDTLRWLEVTVDDGVNHPETLPRIRLRTAPFAFRSASSQQADLALELYGGSDFLPLSGGEMTGAITNSGDPAIRMGKGSFGAGNTNFGDQAFVAGESNDVDGDHATIGGGINNTAPGLISVIGGGSDNSAALLNATVGGGAENTAGGIGATVGGGIGNIAEGERSTVGGGAYNRARGDYSVVGGGGGILAEDSNSAHGNYSTIAGGWRNVASGIRSTVGGGGNHSVSGTGSTIAGGGENTASGFYSFIGGGYECYARGSYAVVCGGGGGGGDTNSAIGNASFIGSGRGNVAYGSEDVICGGGYNRTSATSFISVICGGENNNVTNSFGAICGGKGNDVNGEFSFVGGGYSNAVNDGYSTVCGGSYDTASGEFASVPGGYHNNAAGDYSFAAGRRAKALHDGTFVWGDATDADFTSTGSNQFLIRASGGIGIGSDDPGTSTVLEVADAHEDNYVEMIRLQSTTDPNPGDDILVIEAPSTAPDNFQFIECERGSDVKISMAGNGNIVSDGSITGGGADVAEMMSVSSGVLSVEPGDVMVIDPNNIRALTQSAIPRSTLVAGIYSTAPGFVASPHDWDQIALEKGLIVGAGPDEEIAALPVTEVAAAIGEIPLAVVGIVPCKVSTENGPIRPGDLLVTSSKAGHAMRDDNPRAGTIVGKSLASLESGVGMIPVLVTLQ